MSRAQTQPKRKVSFTPRNEFEHKAYVLPNSDEYGNKYGLLINRHLPMASIKEEILLLVLEKQKGLVESSFQKMAEDDANLVDIANWFNFRLEVGVLLTRAKGGAERQLQSVTGATQLPRVEGAGIPQAPQQDEEGGFMEGLYESR